MVVEAVKDPLHETLHSRQSYNQLWVLEDGGEHRKKDRVRNGWTRKARNCKQETEVVGLAWGGSGLKCSKRRGHIKIQRSNEKM